MVKPRRRRDSREGSSTPHDPDAGELIAGGGQPEVGSRTAEGPPDPDPRALRRRWPRLIRRIFEVGPALGPRCGGGMRIIAFINEPTVIGTILAHLAAKGANGRSPPGSPERHPTAA